MPKYRLTRTWVMTETLLVEATNKYEAMMHATDYDGPDEKMKALGDPIEGDYEVDYRDIIEI